METIFSYKIPQTRVATIPYRAKCNVVLLAFLGFLLSACGTTSQINQGVSYYNQGLYDQAAYQWNGPAQAGDYIAQHNLGLLWKDGLGSTPRNLNEAANWFLLSAQQGYVPAMVQLAECQIMLGNQQPAITWLNLAARWGNQDAVRMLGIQGQPVPAADLLVQQQQSQLNAYSAYNLYSHGQSNAGAVTNTQSGGSRGPVNVCNCKGYDGPGGPCYAGPGGPAYDGPGGPAYSGPGGPCYSGAGGPMYDGPGGPAYDGPGGPMYDGPGGPAYDGPGGPAYDGPGGPCYSGPGGPCYSGPGGTGSNCPAVCK